MASQLVFLPLQISYSSEWREFADPSKGNAKGPHFWDCLCPGLGRQKETIGADGSSSDLASSSPGCHPQHRAEPQRIRYSTRVVYMRSDIGALTSVPTGHFLSASCVAASQNLLMIYQLCNECVEASFVSTYPYQSRDQEGADRGRLTLSCRRRGTYSVYPFLG